MTYLQVLFRLKHLKHLFSELIHGRELLEQAHTAMVYTKAWTGHRNGNGIAVFGWNAPLITCHVTEVLQRLSYLFYSLVPLLFPVSAKRKFISLKKVVN